MPLNNFDAREVTMHYKCKGDRVDEVLHDIVLNHVNRLEQENKRLREVLEGLQRFKDYFNELYGQNLEVANWHLNGELEHFDDFYESACKLIEGEQHEPSTD